MDASRFDAVARSLAHRPSRRRLLHLLAGLGLGSLMARPAARPAAALATPCPKEVKCPEGYCRYCDTTGTSCLCSCVKCTVTGIVGGGAVALASGSESTFTLLATRIPDPERSDAFGMLGHVAWTDPAWEGTGLALESVGLAFYGPLEGVEGGREVAGWLLSDRAPGEHPFVLRTKDADPPGGDTVTIWVGAAVLDDSVMAETFASTPEPGGFRYHAEGALVAGDLRLVSLPNPTDGIAPATPTPS